MKIASLASGSNGNCYYLEEGDDAVLIDAGVSRKQIIERMNRLGLSLSRLRGVFISHEHSDHIHGADVLARKHGVEIFMTQKTYAAYGRTINDGSVHFFSPGQEVRLGSLCVHPFLKSHDAAQPCSFPVSSGDRNVAVMTDIGAHCENVIDHLRQADAVFLESNYDEQMLKIGPYPAHMKRRIASDVGHLSNVQAARLAFAHASARLKHVILSHLSANNNTPELALRTFMEMIAKRTDLNPEIRIASREKEGDVVCL